MPQRYRALKYSLVNQGAVSKAQKEEEGSTNESPYCKVPGQSTIEGLKHAYPSLLYNPVHTCCSHLPHPILWHVCNTAPTLLPASNKNVRRKQRWPCQHTPPVPLGLLIFVPHAGPFPYMHTLTTLEKRFENILTMLPLCSSSSKQQHPSNAGGMS